MRKLTTAVFAALLICSFAEAQTKPSARQRDNSRPPVAARKVDPEIERIFQRFKDAQGTPQDIRAVHSLVMRGVVEVPQYALSGSVELYAKEPNKKLTVLNLPGRMGQILEARIGNGGWGQKPSIAAYDVSDKSADDETGGENVLSIEKSNQYMKLALKGKSIVGGRETYVVEGGTPEYPSQIMYFDVQNGLMVRRDIVKGKGGARSVYFEGFAKVNGIVLPTVVREVGKDFLIITRFYEIKFNVRIEDTLFERPKGPNPDDKEEKIVKASAVQ